MKTIVTVSVLFFGICAAIAQVDSTKSEFRVGISTNMTVNSYSYPIVYSVLGTISNEKHQFDLGPQFTFDRSDYYKNQIGVEANYRYHPNGISKRFSSFLLVNIDFFNRTLDRTYDQLSSDPQFVGSVHQIATRRYYALNAGYGIRFRLVDQFYVSSNVGIGWQIEDYDDNRTSSNSNLNSYKGYVYNNFGFFAAVLLGYRF